jgi:transposase
MRRINVKRKQKKARKKFEIVNGNAAGIDIGGSFHFVAVPEDRDEKHVRKFESFTKDLHQLADWLEDCDVDTVAMESTGVYWIPVYEILEARGFEVLLVNARHVKNVPGRKSDVLDCQWIQQLHSFGLLRASFRPNQEVCQLRAFMRQREMLIKNASSHLQHMHKALSQMNIQLANVVSDISGVTGMKIMRAIVAGELSPKRLSSYRDKRCKQKQITIEKSLEGNYRQEHVFALKQALELYDFYKLKIADCDKQIEAKLQELSPAPENKIERKKPKRRNNELHFDAKQYLQLMVGVDLTKIDGINDHSALKLISEIGLDINRWPTAKHFGSWLGLAPGSKISGGKVLSSKTKPCANRAAIILRIAASTLHHSRCALGAFLRRQKARLGSPKAITATAYKLARIIYMTLKYGQEYVDIGQDYYEKRYKDNVIKKMAKRARLLGFELVPAANTSEEVP